MSCYSLRSIEKLRRISVLASKLNWCPVCYVPRAFQHSGLRFYGTGHRWTPEVQKISCFIGLVCRGTSASNMCSFIHECRLALLSAQTEASSPQRLAHSLLVLMVHTRDILNSLWQSKTASPSCFEWMKQLRYYWLCEDEDCGVDQLQAKCVQFVSPQLSISTISKWHTGSNCSFPRNQVSPSFSSIENFKLKAFLLFRLRFRYRHEYLGEPVGTGGEVFPNIEIRAITDEELDLIVTQVYQGVDFGFAVDPAAFVRLYYDSKHEEIYFLDNLL